MSFMSGSSGPPPVNGAIDYRMARRQVLNEYRRGRLGQQDICDAHPELLRVAREASVATNLECPVCEAAKVVHVTFVFGPRLPKHGRCVTSSKELATLAGKRGDFSVYVVEVCPDCGWNHLARSFPLTRSRIA